MTTDVDVFVAGAGGAGLAAALASTQAGRSTVVAEWRERFRQGNNTSMSTAMIPAGGSRWQHALGIDDSPDTFLDDVRRKTHDTADPLVSRALVDVAPGLVGWLDGPCGIPLELVTDFLYPGHSQPRCHTVHDRSGRTLLAGLLASFDSSAGDLMTGLRLESLTPSGDSWTVALTDGKGAREQIRAGSVVLATGGFGANAALVGEHCEEISGGVYFGGDGCHGDGLRVGQELGADVACLDAYQGHGSLAASAGTLTTWATVMHGGVLLNSLGLRFGDETVGYSEYATRVLAQPGGEAFVVLDERIDAACRSFRDYTDLVAQGGVRWAASVEELAAQTDMPLPAVGSTMGSLGPGDAFGRTSWGAALAAPFGWVRVTGALFHTQGGLAVDGHARVLRGGAVIPGLYAAGGTAVGISGHGASGYLAGNGLLAALGLGYLAGRHASSS